MSWLYTIVFAGLVFSSQGSAASGSEHYSPNAPAPAEVTRTDESEKFDQTYPLNPNGRLSISNVNGSITIEAWDRNEVKLEYTKTADSKEHLANAEVKIDSKPEFISITTDYEWKNMSHNREWNNQGKLQVDYHLMVPRGAMLNEVETVNGSVTVSNFVNMTKVSAVNGTVNATNLRGTANLSTVNGEVIADFDRLDTGSKIMLSTVNGRVDLTIPSDSSATIKADSLNGNITNDFGLPIRKGKYIGRDLYGRLGSGDVRIKLDSVNGGLTIGHKNDGKPVSPVTNLLPQKGKDDDDWENNEDKDKNKDEDKDTDSGYVKTNKDLDRAVKDSQKAVKVAQDELRKAQPAIAQITSENIEKAVAAADKAVQTAVSTNVQAKIQEAQIQQTVLAAISSIDAASSVPRVEQKSDVFPVKGVPTVTVEAKGCAVKVQGWDRSEVQYRVTQFSDPHTRTPIRVTEDHTDSTVNIKIENPDAKSGNFFNGDTRVRIEVFVPRKSTLKIKIDGELRLDGVSGDVDLSGGDESINVRDGDGTLRITNSDGPIRVIGFRGDVTAVTSAGTISLEGDFNKLRANSDGGAILLTLPEETQADLESNCQDIRGEGIALTRIGGTESMSKYRIGKGGALFQVETGGAVQVRGAGTLRESF